MVTPRNYGTPKSPDQPDWYSDVMDRVAAPLLIALFALTPVASLHAQDAPPPSRAATTLIDFTVVVRDKEGNPVADLKEEDLVVTENGEPRKIAFFRFDGDPPQLSRRALPAGHFTNRLEAASNGARHITAILVDGMNSPGAGSTLQSAQTIFREQILAYLDALPPYARVGLFRLGGNSVEVLVNFTQDVASLRAQASKMDLLIPETFATVADNAQTNRIELTLPALEALGDHLARFPGRKTIVWVGNGMPGWTKPGDQTRDVEPQMRRTAERLATQGIAIYPVSSRLAGEPTREALDLFADVTGGRVTLTGKHPAEELKATAQDQRAIYSVGFYAVAPPDNQWHPIRVTARRPNLTVTHLQGYLSEAAAGQPDDWGETEWRSALANPLGSSLVRLDAMTAMPPGARRIDVRMQIALDDLHFRDTGGKGEAQIDIITGERLPSGDFAFRVERATLGRIAGAAPGATAGVSFRLPLRPETAALRVIVRDRFTGRHGTLDISLNQ